MAPINYSRYFLDGYPNSLVKWWIAENPTYCRKVAGTKNLDRIEAFDVDKLPNAVMFTEKRFFPMGTWNLDPFVHYPPTMF